MFMLPSSLFSFSITDIQLQTRNCHSVLSPRSAFRANKFHNGKSFRDRSFHLPARQRESESKENKSCNGALRFSCWSLLVNLFIERVLFVSGSFGAQSIESLDCEWNWNVVSIALSNQTTKVRLWRCNYYRPTLIFGINDANDATDLDHSQATTNLWCLCFPMFALKCLVSWKPKISSGIET